MNKTVVSGLFFSLILESSNLLLIVLNKLPRLNFNVGFYLAFAMEDDVVSMETTQADGKVLPEGGDALIQGAAIAPQAEVTGNMEMMVMDALDPTLLQMKTEVLDGGGTMTVTGGDEGQIITLQVCVNTILANSGTSVIML